MAFIKEDYKGLNLSDPNTDYFVNVHSRGALDFDAACKFLTSQERGSMIVLNLGGAKYTQRLDYKGVDNLVNPNDPVPRTSPTYFKDKKNITFTNHRTRFGYIRDHYLDSPGYLKPLRETFKEYSKMGN